MITLIIVDCQNDFITGTMAVKGAKNSVEEIKRFVKNHRKEIDKILFTVHWHPYNHTSFKKYGGNSPSHCVQYTPGACIESKLLKYIQSLDINYEVSQRGQIEEVDQDSAFDEVEFVTDELGQRYYFDSLVTADANTDFVFCGVSNFVSLTIDRLLKENIDCKIFMAGIISNDGCRTFSQYVKECKLKKVS